MENKKNWPQYTNKMIENTTNILKSGKVNQWTGTKVKEFEKKYAEYFGTKYAIALTNGTVALELCLKAIDLQQGDEIIITPRSFLASSTSINICGGIPVFVDVNENTQNITLDNIINSFTNKTKAVILVHLAGLSCDCEEIVKWCHEHNIYVIEDCAQSHGAKYNGKYVGTFGDINAWSFCQDKIISTGGEGGMVTTNNEQLYKKAWSYKDHGKNYDKIFLNKNIGMFYYVHDSIGTNWRLTEFQASIGIDSLELLDDWIQIRRHNARLLSECLKKYEFIQILEYPEKYYHAYYKYYFYIKKNVAGNNKIRNIIIEEFNKNNICATQGSCSEIYEEECYKNNQNYKKIQSCDISKDIFNRCIMLQVDPTYTKDVMEEYINKIDKILLNLQEKMILIIGCGQHSQVITDIAIDSNFFPIGYIDDNYDNLNNYNYRGLKCIDKIQSFYEINSNIFMPKLICGIGNLNIRKYILSKFQDKNRWATIIHPTSYISQTAIINKGTLIMPHVIINSNSIIGEHNIINSGAIVEHDCHLGYNIHIAPGSVICGGINFGDNVLLGANSVIKNSTCDKKITIGNNVIIGCGSVITKSIDDNTTQFGKI
jgi:sugar O-acyltransferase (sialic acid O-acetyltransferase NeuD family)